METERFGNEEVIKQLPQSLQTLMRLERFHLHNFDRFQDPACDPPFDRKYLPHNCSGFMLPCFWIRRKYFYVYGRQWAEADELKMFDRDGLDERVLFPIHPVDLEHYKEFLTSVRAENAMAEGMTIWAVPTSSTRTLLVWPSQEPQKAVFIKTSLHSPIFGDRRILRSRVGGGVGLSKLVCESLPSLPTELGYLWESVGFVPRVLQDSGVLIRSIPQEVKDERVLVAPLFSLFGGSGDHQPLFLTILERSGMPALELLEDVLCRQFARLWLRMSMQFGLMLEAHGQDLLLVLSPNLAPVGRFLYRDFEGLMVDWELRRLLGLPTPENMPHSWSWHETYATYGYPSYQQVSCKFRTSLYDYLFLVLNELESQLREWQSRGLIGGVKFEEGDIGMMFSRHMLKAVEEMFGVRTVPEYNISRSLNRFVILLMKLRREQISALE